MATVPVYQQGQVSPNAQPVARLNLPASNPAAGFARGIQSAVNVYAQIMEAEQEKADQAALLEAETEYGTYENSMLTGPEGAFNKKGKDSFGVHEQVMPELRKRSGEIEARLRSDRLKLQFRSRVQSRQLQAESQINRHVAQEGDRYDADQTTAGVLQHTERAVGNYNDPQILADSIAELKRILHERGARAGEPPEVTQRKILEAESNTHGRVIDRITEDGRYSEARDYFEKHADAMNAETRASAAKLVREGAVRGESQAQADQIVGTSGSESEAMKATRDIEDPDVRAATETRVRQHYADQYRMRQQAQSDAHDRAAQLLEQSGGNLDAIPPGLKAALPSGAMAGLEARSRQIREGVEPINDWERIYTYEQLSQDQKLKVNLRELRPYVDDATYNRMIQEQQTIRDAKNDPTKAAALTPLMTFKERLGNSVQQAGIFEKTTGLKGDDAARYAKFETEAASRVQALEQQLGRKATGDEMQQVIDDMVMRRVWVGGNWFGDGPNKEKLTIELDEGDVPYVPLDKIPAGERKQIENLIKSNSRAITRDKLQRAYAAYLQGNRAAFLEIVKE